MVVVALVVEGLGVVVGFVVDSVVDPVVDSLVGPKKKKSAGAPSSWGQDFAILRATSQVNSSNGKFPAEKKQSLVVPRENRSFYFGKGKGNPLPNPRPRVSKGSTITARLLVSMVKTNGDGPSNVGP